MAQRILVPTDGSLHSEHALKHAISPFPTADITVLHEVNPGVDVYASEAYKDMRYERIIEELKEGGEEVVVSAREIAAEHDTTVKTEIETGKPAEAIVAYVEVHPIDQIVMGSQG